MLGWWLRVVAAAVRLQLSRGFRAQLISGAVLSPLAAAVYILMARYLGRTDLTEYVVVAPILGGLWGAAMTASGEAIATERSEGTLELLVASPAPASLVAVGRIIATTLQSLIAIPLTLTVAALFGMPLAIAEPVLFVIAIVALGISAAAIGMLFAGLFVLARSASLFTTVINWPLWILGGIAFPLAVLPDALSTISPAISLSWSAATLRAAAQGTGTAWWTGIGAVIVLAGVYMVAAARLYQNVERRVRADGTLSTF